MARFHLDVLTALLLVASAANAAPLATIAANPIPLHSCHDSYPRAAIEAKAEGTVTLRYTITAEGATSDVKVVRSSGNADLDAASIRCVGRWHYKPVEKDGVPVDAARQVSVSWSLADQDR